MSYILLKNVKNYVGQEIIIKGWLNNKRSSGKVHFLELRDGTDYIQAVYAENEESIVSTIKDITLETSLMATGIVSKHPKKENVFELQLTALEIFQRPLEEYPISKKEHGTDFLLGQRHLWLRSKKQWANMKIRNQVILSIHQFFAQEDFVKLDSPIITPVACEGTTTLFEMDYFDLGKAYLSQSGQLYLEAAIFSLNRVYDFGPVFRAEKSSTRKHLIEFWMMDAEMAFMGHEENLNLQERFIKHIVNDVLNNCQKELDLLERDTSLLQKVVTEPFLKMTHKECIDFLQSKGSSITHNDDLGAPDEAILQEHFNLPLFIEKWPAHIKAFYMKRDPQNPAYVLGADLMAPEGFGEIIGGSTREDSYDLILERMKEEKIPLEDFGWYLDTRKYGSVPHSGFGLGLERMVSWMCGTPHIRETIPFPRLLNRIRP